MSASENTKNKLLDTMRKTKEDSSSKPADEAVQPTAKKTETKPAAKKAPAAKPAQKKTADPFQAGRRVWPD